MNFANELKRIREKAGLSQERLAEKIGVSRQAVTKWETGKGIPDIENIISLSSLFEVSIDELLLNNKNEKKDSEYIFESITEYDIDNLKSYDINIGDSKAVFLNGYDGEKIYIKLFSNTISSLSESFKVKVDDIKNRIDIGINKQDSLLRTEAKEGLIVVIQLPNKYLKTVEVSANSGNIELRSLKCENIELDIKTDNVLLRNVIGSVEINCNKDMTITCNSLQGRLAINQNSAISKLFISEEDSFRTIKKGIRTKIYYEKNGNKADPFSENDSDNIIEFNGINSELIISKMEKQK